MTLRYEGVRFSDGSIAVRRIAADPCDRSTTTFEGMRELEEDIGSADVTWIVDRGGAEWWAAQRCAMCSSALPPPGQVYGLARANAVGLMFCRKHSARLWQDANPLVDIGELAAQAEAAADADPSLTAVRAEARRLAAYAGDGHPAVRLQRPGFPAVEIVDLQPGEQPVPFQPASAEPDHYEPTEEVDEP